MAEPKRPKEEKKPAEEGFELNIAELEAEEARSRLSADEAAYLEMILTTSEELERIAAIPDEQERTKKMKEFDTQTALMQEQARLAALPDAERKKVIALNKAEMERLKAEAEQLEREARTFKAPEMFEAMRQIRETSLKKFKELATDNWSELVGFFEDALHHKDVPRADAIMRKLTNDGNENELTNWFGYPSTMQGMHDFVNEVLIGRTDKDPVTGRSMRDEAGEPIWRKLDHLPQDPSTHPLGMGEQEAYMLQSDISYAAEKIGHWEVARVVKRDVSGRFVQMSEEEHALECTIEIGKTRDPRAIARGLNRLAYCGEEIDWEEGNLGDYRRGDIGRSFTPALLGLLFFAKEAEYMTAQFDKKEFNLNLRTKFKEFIDKDPARHKQLLRDAGLPEPLVKRLAGEETEEKVKAQTITMDGLKKLITRIGEARKVYEAQKLRERAAA